MEAVGQSSEWGTLARLARWVGVGPVLHDVALGMASPSDSASNLCCLSPHHLTVVGALPTNNTAPVPGHILDLGLPGVDSQLGLLCTTLVARTPVPVDVLSIHVVMGVLH